MKELFNSHELLLTWAMREFRVRYSQSLLGAAWAILQPLSLMIVFSIIFSFFIRVPSDDIPYPLFVYTALLPWTFFANALTFAIPSLVNNMNLVSKIYFPRAILPLSAILVALVDFVIASSVFVLMLFYFRVSVGPAVLLVPLVLAIQFLLTFGISLAASALNVFYRDVRFVIPLALQIWMYLTPVIYPVDQIPTFVRSFYFANPMAVLIDSYRRVILLNKMPNWQHLAWAALVAVVLTVAAFRFFRNAERQFADVI